MRYSGRVNNPVQATTEEICDVSFRPLPTGPGQARFRAFAGSSASEGARPSFWVLFRLLGLTLLMLATLGSTLVEAQNFAYVVNQGSDSVSVIDTSKNSVVATVPVGNFPQSVAVAPDGAHAYVANVSDSVSVIDTSSNIVSATVNLAAGSEPIAVTVSPDGARAYVANCGSSSVAVISTATNSLAATVSTAPGGICPYGVAVTPAGTRLYVTNIDSSTVSVIDTSSNSVTATVPLPAGSFPVGVTITPDGAHAYVADSGSGAVSVIDTSTNAVTKNITDPSLAGPYGVAVTPDGRHVYVSDSANNLVSEIDTSTNTVVATTGSLNVPIGVAVTPDGAHFYVTNADFAGTVSVIDTTSNSVSASVAVGSYPQSVAIQPVKQAASYPFSAFSVKLEVTGQYHQQSGDRDGHEKRHDNSDDHEPHAAGIPGAGFNLQGAFSLAASSPGIDPFTQPVVLQVGNFSTTIPKGVFRRTPRGKFVFEGMLNGVRLEAQIAVLGIGEHGFNYAIHVEAKGVSLSGVPGTVSVQLQIGPNIGKTTATVGAGDD